VLKTAKRSLEYLTNPPILSHIKSTAEGSSRNGFLPRSTLTRLMVLSSKKQLRTNHLNGKVPSLWILKQYYLEVRPLLLNKRGLTISEPPVVI
jgi:hypothetical protein